MWFYSLRHSIGKSPWRMVVGVRCPLWTTSQSHLSEWALFLRQCKRADSSRWWMVPEQGLSCTLLPVLVLPWWVRSSVRVYVYVCLQMRRCSNPYGRGVFVFRKPCHIEVGGLFRGRVWEMHICKHRPIRSGEAEAVWVLQKPAAHITACLKAHGLPQAPCWTQNWPIYRNL